MEVEFFSKFYFRSTWEEIAVISQNRVPGRLRVAVCFPGKVQDTFVSPGRFRITVCFSQEDSDWLFVSQMIVLFSLQGYSFIFCMSK